MRVSGICAVCGGVAEPAHTCSMCGALVCSRHFSAGHGVCANCLKKIKPEQPSFRRL